MKKILFILTLFLVLFTINLSINAATTLSNGQADKGETVTLDIKLSDTKKVKSGAISFEYDKNYFEIVSGEWKVNGAMVTNFDLSKELGAFAYMSATDITGVIFKITFKVKSTTAYNKYTVKAKLQFEDSTSTKSEETISATITVGCNHNLTVKESVAANLASKATCTSPAKYYYKCSKCGEKGTKTYEQGSALGHTGGTASCTKKAVCTRCNKEYGSLLDHKYGEWTVVKEATEQTEGLKERVCSSCNTKETQAISVLGHTHKYECIIEIEPTCLGKGLEKYVRSCNDFYTKVINSKGHTFKEEEILIEPTETQIGLSKKQCETCGYIELSEISKLNHTHKYDDKYSYDLNNHYKECDCGDKKEVSEHSFKIISETDEKKVYECSVCKYQKEEIINKVTEQLPPTQNNLYFIIMGVEALFIIVLFISLIVISKKKKQ